MVDTSAGVLTFYGTLPSLVTSASPPKISFYKYVGDKGLATSGATSGLNIKNPVLVATATGETISNYSSSLSGYTIIPDSVDSISSGSTFTEGVRILIKNQIDAVQNGIFQVSGTTLVRALDSDGMPTGEVGINDYTFVESGTTNLASSWVLSNTDAFDINKITPGIDTQNWSLFARSASYTSDNLAIKLIGQQFSLLLDGSGIYDSGLQQSINGLKLSDSLASTISGNTSDISTISNQVSGLTSTISSSNLSLSTAILTGNTSLSTAISSGDLSLSTAISSGDTSLSSAISSGDLSLSTAISTGDQSIMTVINNLSGVTATTAGSGLTYNALETSLNVNVDDWTIRIINDKLFGAQQWVQETTSANVTGTTSGYTNIALTYDPVTPVTAYVNGVEYLVNPTTNPATNYPFFYNQYPPMTGTEIWFDPIVSGFTLVSGTDMVVIKYLIVEDLIQ